MAAITQRGTRGMRFVMTDRVLFVRKTLSVFVLAFLLIPLLSIKGGIPAVAYAVGLVVLHIGILAIYFYRVRFGELDPDRKSLFARLFGLALVTYLLMETSGFEDRDSVGILAAKMLVLSLVHMVMLLLLMVRVEVVSPTLDAVDTPEASAA